MKRFSSRHAPLRERLARPERPLRTFLTIGVVIGCFLVFRTLLIPPDSVSLESRQVAQTPAEAAVMPFPVSVDPSRELITENSLVDSYYTDNVAMGNGSGTHTSWIGKTFARLAQSAVYQNLASLSTRVLVIQSGERKEEIADNFAQILKWDDAQEQTFLTMIEEEAPASSEGKFFPGSYIVERKAPPDVVAPLISAEFKEKVLSRYTKEVSDLVPLTDTLIIASLLEREAYDFEDMREISGVIWNRLFDNMRLQLDASLQYAKGSNPDQNWWPRVRPDDKYIQSPFNTYSNKGLPPSPIANPSTDAIIAALNPKKTDCMYYFHDKKGGFHCTATYEEHVALLKKYYGQGK